MKKFLNILFLIGCFCALPAVCDEINADETQYLSETIATVPEQSIKNSKGFLGINYDRQDTKQTGKQKIVNDHSFFNINIQIIKEGALFKDFTNNNIE